MPRPDGSTVSESRLSRAHGFSGRIILLTVASMLVAMSLLLTASAEESAPSPFGLPSATESGATEAPAWFERLMVGIQREQRALQESLADAVRDTGDGGIGALAALLALCFAYGVLHAVGPGHGKAVITAYALTNERIVRRAIGIALLAAFVQATSAVLLVYAVLFAFDSTTRLVTRSVTFAEAASFALIAALGAYLAIGGIRRLISALKRADDAPAVHTHGPDHAAVHAHEHGHEHDHADHAHAHGHHDHAHLPDAETLEKVHSLRDAIALSLAVGIRPCTGAILVLVFAYGLGLHAIGIVASYAMGAGTGLAVATLVAVAGLIKLPQSQAAERGRRWAVWLDLGLRLVGGIAILLLGGLLFWATVTSPARPFVG